MTRPLYTAETAPDGYTGPVRLTASERIRAARLNAWLESLRRMSSDDSDPETRDNARLLLREMI